MCDVRERRRGLRPRTANGEARRSILAAAGRNRERWRQAADMKSTSHIVLYVFACVLLTAPIASGRQQRKLSGIHGLPVEGHDIVAGVEIIGTKQLDIHKYRNRLRSNGAELRLGWPLENQTLCRFKEVLRDVMGEKGFLDAEVTHDTRPRYGDRRSLTVRLTITEGKRASRTAAAVELPSPAQRCSR